MESVNSIIPCNFNVDSRWRFGKLRLSNDIRNSLRLLPFQGDGKMLKDIVDNVNNYGAIAITIGGPMKARGGSWN